jgi:hypothetical protein
VFAGVSGVYIFFRGFRLLQRKRLIENTPTSTIRAAAMGLVEVNGLATGPYTINAPVTGMPCYYHRSVAWQIRGSGKNQHWEKVADESLHVPFYIDDNTGALLVDPQGAEMDIHRDFCEVYSNSLFSTNIGVSSSVAGFLARHGVEWDQKTKVEEFCIKPKNSLFILGTLAENHGLTVSDIPVRSLVTDLPRVVPSPFAFQPVFTPALATVHTSGGWVHRDSEPINAVCSTQPRVSSASQQKVTAALLKAGITSPRAWTVAGVMDTPLSSGSGTAVQTAVDPFDLHPPTVITKGGREQTFYISWKSQRDVLKSLGWKCGLMIWGGPALTLLSAYILSTYFGWF